MGETFALASPERPLEVRAWCMPDGGRRFICLNGSWSGSFDGRSVTHDDGESVPAIEVWRGVVPVAGGYNEAIEWIEEQIAGRA